MVVAFFFFFILRLAVVAVVGLRLTNVVVVGLRSMTIGAWVLFMRLRSMAGSCFCSTCGFRSVVKIGEPLPMAVDLSVFCLFYLFLVFYLFFFFVLVFLI